MTWRTRLKKRELPFLQPKSPFYLGCWNCANVPLPKMNAFVVRLVGCGSCLVKFNCSDHSESSINQTLSGATRARKQINCSKFF